MRIIHLLRKLESSEWSGTEMAVQRLLDGLRANEVDSLVYCPRLEQTGLRIPSPVPVSKFSALRRLFRCSVSTATPAPAGFSGWQFDVI